MLGFSPVLLKAFYNAGIYSTWYHVYHFTTYFNICFTGDRTWSVLVARPALRLGGWTPQNYSMLTQVKTGGKKNFTLRATTFGFFIPNLGIWIQGSGAAGHVSSTVYFSKFWKIKTKRLKTDLTLSLIMRFNLRLGGYSIWSASTSRTIYDQDLGLEHLTA